jgi:hypothetical protein
MTIRATPFVLMNGVEAVLSIELEVPSLKIVIDKPLDCSQSFKN